MPEQHFRRLRPLTTVDLEDLGYARRYREIAVRVSYHGGVWIDLKL